MRTKALALSLIAGGLIATSAKAQYVFDLTTPVNVNNTASGKWLANLDSVDSLTWTLKIIAYGGINIPNVDAQHVSVGIDIQGGGTTTYSAGVVGPGFNDWSNNSTSSAAFFGTGPANASGDIKRDGTNLFQSTFTITPTTPGQKPTSIFVDLEGRGLTPIDPNFSNTAWSGRQAISAAVTPELPGAMQLVPALIPLGMFFRRRRKAN